MYILSYNVKINKKNPHVRQYRHQRENIPFILDYTRQTGHHFGHFGLYDMTYNGFFFFSGNNKKCRTHKDQQKDHLIEPVHSTKSTERSAMHLSSNSPLRWLTIIPNPAALESSAAQMDSITMPFFFLPTIIYYI